MLLIRMSSPPKSTVGRRMAYDTPDSTQRPLEPGLAAEVLQRRVFRRIGDADVDDALDACLLGGAEHGERVLDGRRLGARGRVEPHPVRVVEDRAPRGAIRRSRSGRSKSSGLASTRSPKRFGRSGELVSVRTRRPESKSRWAMYPPEYPKAAGDDMEFFVRHRETGDRRQETGVRSQDTVFYGDGLRGESPPTAVGGFAVVLITLRVMPPLYSSRSA